MSIPILTYRNNLLISAPKIHADLLWDLSVLFVGLTTVYFLAVFFYRQKISKNSKKVRDRKRELSPMISEFLFLEEDATKDEKSNYVALKIEIRQLLKDSFNRKVLLEILLDLRKDVSGEAQQILFKLYEDFGLHQDAFAKLKSWRWQIISKGILELTQMEVIESYGFITEFINDKRSTVRKQAEIATVTLRHEGINHFLDTTKYRISEWQQLKLLDVLRNKEDFEAPRFKAWLTSNNKYVVLFALRLIKHYNQNDANASVIELVKHKKNQIKKEAIACIREFNVTESLDTLKLVFWKTSTDVKIAILGAIAQIGSEADIEFLKLIDKKELNFSVKSKALSSINTISPESIMPSKGIQNMSRHEIPDDISEAEVMKHAKKHEDLSGENDVEYNDDVIVEKHSEDEIAFHPKEDYSIDKADVETEVEIVDEEIVPIASLVEQIDNSQTKEEANNIDKIEEDIEQEITIEEKIIENELDGAEWADNHLDFLPKIIIKDESEIELESSKTDNYDSSKLTKELFNIQVIHEELMSYENTNGLEEDTQNEEKSSYFDEFNIRELAFLPIVVDNELELQNTHIEEPENNKVDILDILVQYDEVPHNLPVEKEKNSAKDLELDSEFFHELKDIEISEYSKNKTNLDHKNCDTEEILNAEVIYQEVNNLDTSLDILEIEVIDSVVFPTEAIPEQILDITFTPEVEERDEIVLPIENEQLLQKIIDDLLLFDNKSEIKDKDIKIDDSYINPDWDLDEDDLDFTPISFENKEEQPNYIRINKIQETNTNERDIIPKASIPKAIFGDIEFEASTRQLLNDLEEMGDQREAPFLKELLTHEKYDLFKERINNLIDSFNHDRVNEKIDNPLQPFSVFQDLFRTCDIEAKLILLNEVVEVGDEKELHFLEDLTKDDSLEIRKKAIEVLKELRIKLFGNEEEDLKNTYSSEIEVAKSIDFEVSSLEPSNDSADIFDLNFDFTEELDENDDEKKNSDEKQNTVQYGSFFGQICLFSHKIMEKLNG